MWSDDCRRRIDGLYAEILRTPFVRGLARGTLPPEVFRAYLHDDEIYLKQYSRIMRRIASRLERPEHARAFEDFAARGVDAEHELHRSFMATGADDAAKACPSPAFTRYMALQTVAADAPAPLGAAVMLPCFTAYRYVGLDLAARTAPANPYQSWIDAYAGEEFGRDTARIIRICDELAADTPQLRRAMTIAFIAAAQAEWFVWNSAYTL